MPALAKVSFSGRNLRSAESTLSSTGESSASRSITRRTFGVSSQCLKANKENASAAVWFPRSLRSVAHPSRRRMAFIRRQMRWRDILSLAAICVWLDPRAHSKRMAWSPGERASIIADSASIVK